MNGKRPGWFLDWTGECVAIVGAGPSVKQADVDRLHDRIHVVAINTSYKLCKWADVLYSCDNEWWKLNKGATDFPGLKITQNDQAVKDYPDIKKVDIRRSHNAVVNDFLMDKPGEIGGGGNSGFQMVNPSVQFGGTAIMLIGFDLCGDNNQPHWHGRHPSPMNNPIETNFRTWRETLEKAKPKLDALGIDVVNCSPISTLKQYPKISIDEAFRRWTL